MTIIFTRFEINAENKFPVCNVYSPNDSGLKAGKEGELFEPTNEFPLLGSVSTRRVGIFFMIYVNKESRNENIFSA